MKEARYFALGAHLLNTSCGLYPELELIKSHKGNRTDCASDPMGRENM